MTDGRRETVRKYNASAKGKAAQRRFRQTAKGRALSRKSNLKRVGFGKHHRVYLPTQEMRDQARAIIKRRQREFVTRQSRGAEAEGVQAVSIRPEAAI